MLEGRTHIKFGDARIQDGVPCGEVAVGTARDGTDCKVRNASWKKRSVVVEMVCLKDRMSANPGLNFFHGFVVPVTGVNVQ